MDGGRCLPCSCPRPPAHSLILVTPDLSAHSPSPPLYIPAHSLFYPFPLTHSLRSHPTRLIIYFPTGIPIPPPTHLIRPHAHSLIRQDLPPTQTPSPSLKFRQIVGVVPVMCVSEGGKVEGLSRGGGQTRGRRGGKRRRGNKKKRRRDIIGKREKNGEREVG